MRKRLTFHISDPNKFKEQLLFWSKSYEYVSILDSNEANRKVNSMKEYNTYELIAGVDALQIITPHNKCFESLQEQIEKMSDWWFGYLGYDLKNEIESLQSENQDYLGFPEMNFFRPRWVFIMDADTLLVDYFDEEFTELEISNLIEKINAFQIPEEPKIEISNIQNRISKNEYLDAVGKLKEIGRASCRERVYAPV